MVSVYFRSRPAFQLDDDAESTDAPTDAPSPMSSSSYYGYGRIFQRQTSPFIAISTIVVAGIRHETADSDDEGVDDVAMFVFYPLPHTASQTDEHSTTYLYIHSRRAIQCWDTLCSIVPNFREQMLQLSADPKTRKAVCSQVSPSLTDCPRT